MRPSVASGLRWGAAIGWAAVIFALSSIPGADLPGPPIPSADKLVHLAVYATLGWLCFRCIEPPLSSPASAALLRKSFLVTVLVVLAYGISDEFHQSFVPRRSPDVMDVLADVVGGALGAGWGARRAAKRRARRAVAAP